MSNKNRIVAWTIVATAVAAIAPVAAMMWLSRQAVAQAEHERLARYAESVIARAAHSFDETQRSLKSLSPLLLLPCSDEHIAQMRLISVNSRSIEEMGYYEHGQLKCTSWDSSVGARRRRQAEPV